MRSTLRAAVPLALLAGLAAASPAIAEKPAPKAKASGGDVVELTYPSIVQVRVDRAERALDRATTSIEDGQAAGAETALTVVRRQTAAAWRGAQYVIRTTPPPPAEEARVRPRARTSGGAPAGPTYAGPADSAFRVLTLQHKVSSTVVQLIDGAHGTGLNGLSTTLNQMNDRRDQALQYILGVAPPAPPEAEDARAQARASGDAPVTSTFDTVMPNLLPQLDDELQAIEGTKTDATDLTAGGQRLLADAETQITATKTVVNTNWPPVPAED